MTTQRTSSKPAIGFMGMGNMGHLMVQRLMQAGYPLIVYDRTKEKAQEAAQQKAQVADTPKDLAARSDVLMSCVTNGRALEAIALGPDGALAGAKAGTPYIEMSTVAPDTSRHIHDEAKKRQVSMIDAAVSGSTPEVQKGSLVIFVGGDKATYEQCKPILGVLGKASFYMGESGMGTTMKLVVNTLLGLGLQAVAEAIALGEKAGLNKQQLIDILGQTAVIAPTHKAKLANLEHESFPTNFALAMMRKDFSLILHLAADVSAVMPATAAAEQMYAAALATGKDGDYSLMLQFMEQLSGISHTH